MFGSLLFVAGNRPDLIAKAVAAGADACQSQKFHPDCLSGAVVARKPSLGAPEVRPAGPRS